MTYERITGGIYLPDPFVVPSLGAVGPIDATGEKFAIIGRVRWKDNAAAKNIRRVQFLFGTVTKAGGSGLTVSLQDVSTTSGPTFQPDGAPDQTVAVANGDAAFASDTWYRSGALNAERAAAHGELLAVVIEYDGSGRLGADSVRLSADASAGRLLGGAGISLFTSSWPSTSVASCIANVVLEADDGTLGTLDGARPLVTTAGETPYDSGSTPDETGIAFTLPFNCYADAIWAQVRTTQVGADFDLCLYKGTTLLRSVSVDYNTIAQASATLPYIGTIEDIEIEKDVEHYVTVKPTTANDVGLWGLTVNDASHWDLYPGGQAMHYISRVDGGSWDSPTTTKRVLAGIRISQVIGSGGESFSATFV